MTLTLKQAFVATSLAPVTCSAATDRRSRLYPRA
jgi:hypothetical protein